MSICNTYANIKRDGEQTGDQCDGVESICTILSGGLNDQIAKAFTSEEPFGNNRPDNATGECNLVGSDIKR